MGSGEGHHPEGTIKGRGGNWLVELIKNLGGSKPDDMKTDLRERVMKQMADRTRRHSLA